MRRRSDTLGFAVPTDSGPVDALADDAGRRKPARREVGALGGTCDDSLADAVDHELAASLNAAAEGGGAEAQAGALGGAYAGGVVVTAAGASGGAAGGATGVATTCSAGRARSASRSARRLIGATAVVCDESIGTRAAVATSAWLCELVDASCATSG